jgi:hypothetical protein
MPANTARGYPYPLNTDPVTNGDDTIKALAEAVNNQLGAIACGGVSITSTGTNPSNGSTAVTFPVGRFTGSAAAPRVIMQQTSAFVGGTGGYAAVYPSAISVAGFTANVRRADVQTTSMLWVAVNVDT